MKQCSQCMKRLPFAQFYHRKKSLDGYEGYCKQCHSKYKTTLHQKWATVQKCRYCPDKWSIQAGSKNYCPECWVDYVVKAMVGPAAKRYGLRVDKNHTEYLIEGLYQRFLVTTHCPYTGEPLTPGVNMDLDHKIPKIRNQSLIFTLDNLQWVSRTYNKAKASMTDEEFAARYTLIFKKV